MNRSVDYRTDFYSLGVTFYELLTLQLPFKTKDPLELVHAHIAKKPELVCEASQMKKGMQIPEMLSNIVMKLMEKNAEDRYQSTIGISKDLQECRQQLINTGKIYCFKIAEKDICERFQPQQKLYGRQKERKFLSDAFYRASQGKKEMILIAGYSGIGKTRLVHEVYRDIRQKNTDRPGYFISGKFDQFKRNIPYAPVIEAFQQLIHRILTESDKQINLWKSKLLKALHANGQIIIDVIPELALIIGNQPDVPDLPPVESQKRFKFFFLNFIRVFANANHPLTIFIDDLQWIDLPSLNLIELFMSDTDMSNLLFIGAYRYNEVDSTHPLILMQTNIMNNNQSISTLTLSPLSEKNVNQMVAETMHCDEETSKPLSTLCLEKTDGNPFFLNQFLQTLYQQHLIEFNPKTSGWGWHIERIKQAQLTDNIVDFLIGKLQNLPENTLNILKIAAVLGSRFSIRMLSKYNDHDEKLTMDYLWPALHQQLVFPVEAQREKNSELIIAGVYCQFSHDRIQQAAYSLNDTAQKSKIHLKLGQMFQSLPEKERDDYIFDIVSHLNEAEHLITEKQQKLELCNLNVIAGKKAKQSIAYVPAIKYLKTAKSLIGDTGWHQHYKLTYKLFRELSEVTYLNGDYETSQELIDEILSNVQNNMDRCEILNLLIIQNTMSGDIANAITIGLEALNLLGIKIPEKNQAYNVEKNFFSMRSLLMKTTPAEFLKKPEMSNPRYQLSIKILANIGPPTFLTNMNLYKLTVIEMVELTAEYGITRESAGALGAFALILSEFGHYHEALDCLNIGMSICQNYNDFIQKCKNSVYLAGHVNHWKNPISQNLSISDDGYQSGVNSGELQWAGYNFMFKATNGFYVSKNLKKFAEELEKLKLFTAMTKNTLATHSIEGTLLSISNLQNSLNKSQAKEQEEKFISDCHVAKSAMALAFYAIRKIQELYYLDKINDALVWVEKAEKMLPDIPATFPLSMFQLYKFLTLIKSLKKEFADRKNIQTKLDNAHKQITIWAENCPNNYKWMNFLIDAETARIKNKSWEALNLYEQAIKSAKDSQCIQNEALTNELAAKFFIEKNISHIAGNYMTSAHYAYKLWGADHKVKEIESKYAFLLTGISVIDNSLRNTTRDYKFTSQTLDLGSLVKSCQMLSSETNFEKLLVIMMKIVMENSGAKRGILISKTENKWLIEYESDVTILESDEFQSVPQELSDNRLAVSIINFVIRTKDTVVLNDTQTENAFIQDPYIRNNEAFSIFCIPLIYQDSLTGMLYLENSLTQAFTEKRIETLKVLSSQIAISIENARTHEHLEELVEKRTHSLKLTVEQLKKTKEAAEKANQAKSIFLANMSHEIRTPINAILGFSKILKEMDASSEKQIEKIDHIIESSNRLLYLINDILDISKVEAGKIEIINEVFSVSKLMNQIVSTFLSAVDKKGLFLKKYINPDTPEYVKADVYRIEQVLKNLIGNAIKFTDQGQIEVSVKLKDNSRLLFCVKDTGEGIPEDKHQQLFSKFFQADSSYAKRFSGAGLGLAISKELVKLMKGEIWFDSKMGKGSTFYFTITIEKPESFEIEKHAESNEIITAPKIPLRILMAEDDILNRKTSTYFLKKDGHMVTHATNGFEVIEHLKKNTFDLILMDIQMPKMDGVETTKRIRASSSNKFDPQIPIIATTAYAMRGDKDRFIKAGMNDYLCKPIDVDILRVKMNKISEQFESKRTLILSDNDTINSSELEKQIDDSFFKEDIQSLIKMFDNNQTILSELFTVFLSESKKFLNQLKFNLENNQLDSAADYAHKIASSMSGVQIRSIPITRKLENAARSGDIENCFELFEKLKIQINDIRVYLKTIKLDFKYKDFL